PQPFPLQAAHLVHQTGVEHAGHALVNALVQFTDRAVEPDQHRRVAGFSGLRQVGRERLAGDLDDLQRANYAASVARQDRLRRSRVELPQLFVQLARPHRVQLRLVLGPHLRVGAGEGELVDHRLDVQSGSAGQDGRPAAGQDLLDGPPGLPLVSGYRSGFPDVQHVEQVVRHSAALLLAQLRRADVHPAVQLHRVRVDDFPTDGQSQFHGEVRLPSGGGSDDYHQTRWRLHVYDLKQYPHR